MKGSFAIGFSGTRTTFSGSTFGFPALLHASKHFAAQKPRSFWVSCLWKLKGARPAKCCHPGYQTMLMHWQWNCICSVLQTVPLWH